MDKVLRQSNGRLAYVLGIAAWLVYACISMFAPRGGNTYHVNPTSFILIQLSIILPIFFIWMTAIYGAVKFRSYSWLIRSSADGAALNKLSIGLYLLITSIIVQTLLSVFKRLSKDTPMLNTAVFLHNHVPVIIALTAVVYIYLGSRMLVAFVNAKIRGIELAAALVAYVAVIAWLVPYLYAHISHSLVSGVPNFILPGHWPFFTMALPYMVAWLLGILSILNIITYARSVKGPIYRAGLKYVASGIMVIVTLAMFIQIITFLANALQKLNLNSILLLVYVLLILYAVGFFLVAVGARKLARIEVVQ